uniref:Uncharacterized protein n=1 Tax=Anguilla anguilla TaxID=7936 RepID=A0A0E9UHW3_ANGAN
MVYGTKVGAMIQGNRDLKFQSRISSGGGRVTECPRVYPWVFCFQG